MIKKSTFTICFTFTFLLFATSLVSQTGSIKGLIYEEDQKSTLPGCNVYLVSNLSIGVASDLDGSYLLSNVPVGTHLVKFSYTGYADFEKEVVIEEGKMTNLDVTLAPMAYSGTEVIVTAQALGQTKAINQQLNSDAIANFVSAEKIKELPDVNAAEAISRLPGVAINRSGGEGSKVVVRGLDPKFTAISVNGVRLPSTSGTDRSVDLSLISPELLSGIELFKSPTPDMDGDAIGGSINLNILQAPKERKISIKALGGYNALGGTFSDYKTTLAFSQRVWNDKLGIIATANVEQFNRGGEIIGQGWGDNMNEVIDDSLDIFEQEGRNLRFEKRVESRKRYNGSIGFDFKLGERTDVSILGIYSRTSRDQYRHQERYDVNNNRITYTPRITESAINLFSGSMSMRHNLNKLQIEWGTAYSRVLGETPYDFQMTFWDNSSPFDQEVINNLGNPSSFFDFIVNDGTKDYLQETRSTTSSNQEDILSGYLNFTVPFQIKNKINIDLKFGGKVVALSKDRIFDESFERLLYLTPNSRWNDLKPEGEVLGATGIDPSGTFYLSMANFTNRDQVKFERENGEAINLKTSFDTNIIRRYKDLYEQDLRKNLYQVNNNYDLTENVYATYAMLKVKFGNKLTIIPGFRYELSDNAYNGIYADLSGDFGESGGIRNESVDRNYGIFLPHLHLKYKPLDWFDIRASYSTTLARPDYNYVVPATLVNRNSDLVITQGNPDLNASVSTNYDLYLTAYSGRWGLLSIGGFYKDIKDAFYPFIVGLNNNELAVEYGFPDNGFAGAELTTFSNSPESNVSGFEIDLQSNMNFLPKPFDGFVVNFNYSRLFSKTTINSFFEETRFVGIPPFFQTIVEIFPFQRDVDLIGQARHILNASLGYDIKSFSARISASYQGSKLSGYSSSSDKDTFNRSFWRFDAVLKQKFGRNFNVFINLNNISNQKDVNFFRNENFVTSIARFGPTATIGAEYIIR